MEDLWCVQNSSIDLDELADAAEYRRFLARFCDDEEKGNQQRLFYGEEIIKYPNREL